MQVFCRFRPLSDVEAASGEGLHVEFDTSGKGLNVQHPIIKRHVPFAFQGVFSPDAGQCEVYNRVGKPVLDAAMAGYNAAVICYGQTASGKTYTMFCPPDLGADQGENVPDLRNFASKGLIPRIVEDLFKHTDGLPGGVRTTVKGSFVEINKEKVLDLLMPGRPKLLLRDFSDYCVTSASEITPHGRFHPHCATRE
jgi:hypothetical protein